MADEENKHAGGRPPLFTDAEALKAKIEEYFVWVKGEKVKRTWVRKPSHVTITGLALFLGFESRQSIYDYEERGEFSYIIKNARLRVEECYEQNLHGNNCTGSIFALKNMGWRDKQEQELTGKDGEPLCPAPVINYHFNKPQDPPLENKGD